MTPAFNSEGFLGDASASVIAQTFSDFAWLIEDDRSGRTLVMARGLEAGHSRTTVNAAGANGRSGPANSAMAADRAWYFAVLDDECPRLQTQSITMLNNLLRTDSPGWGGGNAFTTNGGPSGIVIDHNTIVQDNASGIVQSEEQLSSSVQLCAQLTGTRSATSGSQIGDDGEGLRRRINGRPRACRPIVTPETNRFAWSRLPV